MGCIPSTPKRKKTHHTPHYAAIGAPGNPMLIPGRNDNLQEVPNPDEWLEQMAARGHHRALRALYGVQGADMGMGMERGRGRGGGFGFGFGFGAGPTGGPPGIGMGVFGGDDELFMDIGDDDNPGTHGAGGGPSHLDWFEEGIASSSGRHSRSRSEPPSYTSGTGYGYTSRHGPKGSETTTAAPFGGTGSRSGAGSGKKKKPGPETVNVSRFGREDDPRANWEHARYMERKRREFERKRGSGRR